MLGPSSQVHEASVNLAQVDPLQLQWNKMWNADFFDVKPMDPVMSVDDKTALKSMKDSVKLVDGKYQLGIPWRMDPKRLFQTIVQWPSQDYECSSASFRLIPS